MIKPACMGVFLSVLSFLCMGCMGAQKNTTDASLSAIAFHAETPYRLEFGRGSGHRGLETIVIDENGRVVLHRMTYESVDGVGRVYWERGTLTLPPYAIRNLALSIRQQRILYMNRAYHADGQDGGQWIFRLVQEGQEKTIYFNNHFPNRIRRFAVILDDILKDAGIDAVTWSRVPDAEARDHEKPIWQSIRH